jgi:hypothetical protein
MFEALYLSRSTTRLNEAVSQAFAGGSRAPPGANEGVVIARAVMNELDSARFDPLLMLAVARNVGVALDGATTRVDGLVSFSALNRYHIAYALKLDLFRSLSGYTSWANGDSTTNFKWSGCDIPLLLLDEFGEGS